MGRGEGGGGERRVSRVKERGAVVWCVGAGEGGWQSHMSQQHAVVSQMSRLVSLRTPSRAGGVAVRVRVRVWVWVRVRVRVSPSSAPCPVPPEHTRAPSSRSTL